MTRISAKQAAALGLRQTAQDTRKGAEPAADTPRPAEARVVRRGGAPREQDIQRGILDALAWRGVYALRINSGAIRTERGGMVRGAPAGTPDVLCIVGGRAVFLEVKRPGNKPTALQLEMHARLRAAGATVVVVTSVDEALEAVNG